MLCFTVDIDTAAAATFCVWWHQEELTRCVLAPWSPGWISHRWGRLPSSGRSRKCRSRLCRLPSSQPASRSGHHRVPGRTRHWRKAPASRNKFMWSLMKNTNMPPVGVLLTPGFLFQSSAFWHADSEGEKHLQSVVSLQWVCWPSMFSTNSKSMLTWLYCFYCWLLLVCIHLHFSYIVLSGSMKSAMS